MERRLGSLAPFFLFLFPLGSFVTPWILEKGLDWDFPSCCSSFSLRGRPASALAVAGNGCRVLSVLRHGYLVPFRDSSLPLLRSTVSFTTFRVCLPQAPALWQVLEALLAEGALESLSVLVLAFQPSLPSGEVV